MKIWITTASAVEMDIVKSMLMNHLPQNAVFSIGGVGLVATAIHACNTLSIENPDLAIQVGIAGRLGNKRAVGSASLVQADCIGDQGVWEGNHFNDSFDLNLSKVDDFPYQHKWLINELTSSVGNKEFQLAKSVSVNQITTDPKMIDHYLDLQAEMETMEGAAFHWACLENKIPFMQIRGISNEVGDRNKNNWKIKDALETASNTALQFIESYRSQT